MYLGGIEAGGTKFICGVCDDDLKLIDQVSISTTTPEETMELVFAFFDRYRIVWS